MKKLLLLFFFAVGVLHGNAQDKNALPKPNPQRLVNDYANLLDSYDRDQLERKLVALDDSTSNQIAIITIKSLNDKVLEDVAVSTFREWGIGNKKTRNGVLILVVSDEHKVRIEVGYGLEGAIPDITANNIIEYDIKPAFRKNNYYAGLNKAVDDLSKAAVGEYKVKRARSNNPSPIAGGGLLKFIFILFIILILVMRGGRGGGGGGGWVAPMLLGSMLGGGGRSSGGWSGGGGGGFGGFGGGSSGGGGASGGW